MVWEWRSSTGINDAKRGTREKVSGREERREDWETIGFSDLGIRSIAPSRFRGGFLLVFASNLLASSRANQVVVSHKIAAPLALDLLLHFLAVESPGIKSILTWTHRGTAELRNGKTLGEKNFDNLL